MNPIEMKTNFILKAMGNSSFDLDEFAQTETYRRIYANMTDYCTIPDENDPELLAHWEAKGLKKELHQADEGGKKWASYLPLEAAAEGKNANGDGKKYPLVFVLHGNANPIYLAETYGYCNIAAREKLILILPEEETEERIDELFEYAKANYPVDLHRVYMVGFSLGGIRTSWNSIAKPERYAAVGWGGMIFTNGSMGAYEHMGEKWAPIEYTDELIRHAAEVGLPMIDVMGEQEMIDVMPLTKDLSTDDPAYQVCAFQSANKIASVNNWRAIAGCSRIPESKVRKEAAESDDIVVRKIGFPFEKTQVLELAGRKHYVGDCVNPEGKTLARFVCVEKTPHWPSQEHCELIWSFISQYTR